MEKRVALIGIIVEDMEGNQLYAFSETVDVKANSCFNLSNLININVIENKESECYARIIFMEDDTILSERLHFFTYPKDLKLIKTDLNPKITFNDGKYYLTFNSEVFVKDVYVTASVPGNFSDNFFCWFDIHNFQTNQTVINQNISTNLDIFRQGLICDGNFIFIS